MTSPWWTNDEAVNPGMRSLALLLAGIFLGTLVPGYSQAPPAPVPPKNMIVNPSFETGFRVENIWNGVDAAGYLVGNRGQLPILSTSGAIDETAMPISISIADMNGDGLMDIVAMDPLGYLRIYFNSGTKTEPKFTMGELASIFLSRIDSSDPTLHFDPAFQGDVTVAAWSAGSMHLKSREQWIGWNDEQRRRRLPLVVNNARLLGLPGAGRCQI